MQSFEPDVEITSVLGGYIVTRADQSEDDQEEETQYERTHLCTTIDEVLRIVRIALEHSDKSETAREEAGRSLKNGRHK